MSRRNENRPGYKKTKVGWIPEERECSAFSAIAKIEMGQSPDGKSYNTEGVGYPLISKIQITHGASGLVTSEFDGMKIFRILHCVKIQR